MFKYVTEEKCALKYFDEEGNKWIIYLAVL